jgi:hypothetical protein
MNIHVHAGVELRLLLLYVIFLHPVAHNIVQSFSSVFVRHTFNYLKYFKTLKQHLSLHVSVYTTIIMC